MLSGSKDGGGLSAEYYSADNYYAADEGTGESSQWSGKGADRLGLTGKVDNAAFNSLRQGQLPDGTPLDPSSKQNSGEHSPQAEKDGPAGKERTPGWDMTFSVPKSVSLMALVGKDERLIKAAEKAAATAMAYMESNATTRVREGRVVREVKTANLVTSRFTQHTSRKGDPQLHLHNYIHNLTWNQNKGQWQAVHSPSLFASKEATDRIFMASLREEARKAGYDVTPVDPHGNWEIKGVPTKVMEDFSKRRADIEQAAKATNAPLNRATMERLALITRPTKDQSKMPGNNTERWRAEAGGRNTRTLDALAGQARLKATTINPLLNSRPLQNAGKAVRSFINLLDPRPAWQKPAQGIDGKTALQRAISHTTENSAVMHNSDLITRAITFSHGDTSPTEILQAYSDALKSGELVEAEKYKPGHVTTSDILKAERDLINTVKDASPSWTALAGHDVAAQAEHHALSKDQKQGFRAMLDGTQRYALVQGFAGTGKSYMVQAAHATLQKHSPDTKLLVLAPLHRQVEELRDKAHATLSQGGKPPANFEAATIARFVTDMQALQSAGKDLPDMSNTHVVIDEAGLMGNKDAQALVSILENANAGRVVMMGDPKQKSAPSAGAPFIAMLKSGLKSARLDFIQRQKSANYLQAARLAATGKPGQALKAIGSALLETGKDSMEARAVAEWKSLPGALRSNALMVTTTRARRDEINGLIHEARLKDLSLTPEERLKGEGATHTTLVSLNLSETQRRHALGVRENHVLIFNRNLRAIGVTKGDQLKVLKADPRTGRMILLKADGTRVQYQAPGDKHARPHYDAFQEKSLSLHEGEKLVWTKSFPKHGDIKANTDTTIVRIDRSHITLRDDRGIEQTFERTDPRLAHLNYGYAHTSVAAQGTTANPVIAVAGAADRYAGDQAHNYVALTRVGGPDAKNEHLVYVTDDKAKLTQRLNMNRPIPDSALAHVKAEPAKEPPVDAKQPEPVLQSSRDMNTPSRELDMGREK
ncbi:MAG TPA: hypothetical protein DF715_09160 [Oceanicaulis sp.]|nr:hypothetical protein [Oceanicaulis sp.]